MLTNETHHLYRALQTSSIEAAVFRFEYALKRIAELEQQLSSGCCRPASLMMAYVNLDHAFARETQQVKYQTYLGLSRCERKRKVSVCLAS